MEEEERMRNGGALGGFSSSLSVPSLGQGANHFQTDDNPILTWIYISIQQAIPTFPALDSCSMFLI